MTLIGFFVASLAAGFVAGLINLFVHVISDEIETGIWWGMLVWAIATTVIFVVGLHYRDIEYHIVNAFLLVFSTDVIFVSIAFLLRHRLIKN